MIAEYSEDERQARVYGKFQHLIGLVFKQWDRKMHTLRPFNINNQEYCVYEMLDPHPRNPDAVLWVAVDRNLQKFVIDELYLKCEGGTEELAQRIKQKAGQYRVVRRLADPSAFIEDQHTSKSLATRLSHYGLHYLQATKARTNADRRIADALNYQKRGDELIMSPEVYIFDTCQRTIFEFEHYRWDEWTGKVRDKKDAKQKPIDKDDHMIENLGRCLIQEPRFEAVAILDKEFINNLGVLRDLDDAYE